MPRDAATEPQLLHLLNNFLEVSILPEVGAKIFDLIARSLEHNFLWHNPRISPQQYPVEANFDNYWCGGWDDAFPTCEACSYNGEQYPNLGELRSVRWRVETVIEAGPDPCVILTASGPITPVQARKTVRIRERSLEMEFRVQNVGHLPIDFLWGTHPAFAIEPNCVLHIPARTGLVAQANQVSLGTPGQRYEWPIVRSGLATTDMSRVPSPGTLAAGHYALDLKAGWYHWSTRTNRSVF